MYIFRRPYYVMGISRYQDVCVCLCVCHYLNLVAIVALAAFSFVNLDGNKLCTARPELCTNKINQ